MNGYTDHDFPDPDSQAALVPVIEEKEPAKRLALTVVSEAHHVAVFDQITLTRANDMLKAIKAGRKNFDEEFDKGITEAYQHHRTLVAQKKKWTDPLDEAEKIIKPKIAMFLRAEDDKRREAERAAERARAEAAKEADDTADVAHELIRQGRTDEAHEVVEMQAERIEKIQASAPVVPEKVVAAGSSLTKRWTWDRVTVDIEAMAKDEHARKFLKVDEAKVTRYVQNMKWDAKIAGVNIYSVDDVATRIGG